VLDFLGLRYTAGIDPGILSRKYRTFRDGRVGQGTLTLTAEQQRRLRRQFSYYPGVDFGKYGL